jgi:hypothetical protein
MRTETSQRMPYGLFAVENDFVKSPDPQNAEAFLICKIKRFNTIGPGNFADGIGVQPGVDSQTADRFPDFNDFGVFG